MKDNNRHNLILAAATTCFARFGYDKTTLDDIGRQAGLNKASLYYYYKNKESIFTEVVLSKTRAYMAELQTKLATYPDTRRQIRFLLTERIKRYEELVQLTEPSTDQLKKLDPVFEAAYQESRNIEITFLTGLLRRASQDSDLAVNLPSSELAEHLFQLSDAIRHELTRNAGFGAPGAIDYSPAINQMEFWTKLLLR
jgi:AcrR family transcriptional regulator